MSVYSTIPERNFKAKVAGMVFEYLASRDFAVSYSAIVHDITNALGLASDNEIGVNIVSLLASFANAGAIVIGPASSHFNEGGQQGYTFSCETTVKASEKLLAFTCYEAEPYDDDER